MEPAQSQQNQQPALSVPALRAEITTLQTRLNELIIKTCLTKEEKRELKMKKRH
ncbi:hypothetical protein BGX33_011992, partial [Mortierella sp. NVP41]